MESETCYVCGRTSAEVAEFFESDIRREKERIVNREQLGADAPNPADVYSKEEYELAKACENLADGLLSTPVDEYEAKRESLSTKYTGIETLDRLLLLPLRKNPAGIGVAQKTLADRVKAVIATYEKARDIDGRRAERRKEIENGFRTLAAETEWMRQTPIQVPQPQALRGAGRKMYSPHLSLKTTLCIVCAAWEPEVQALKNSPASP